MRIVVNRFNFATTIGIISGHPRFDTQTARIIDVLKEQSKEKLQFIGFIGDQYAGKLTKSYGSTSVLDHEQISVTRNYNELVQDWAMNPYRTITHWKNYRFMKNLKAGDFLNNLHAKNAPAVITVGNYSLMLRFYTALNQFYQSKNTEKPLRLAFDLMAAYRTIDNQSMIDYLYYNLPRVSESNITAYAFPGMCIGYEQLFRAFQFLQKYKDTTRSQNIKHQQFSIEVNDLVTRARRQYRKSKGFSQDQYITLLAPGNTEKEIKFSLKSFIDGLKVFKSRDNIKTVNKDFFRVLVLLPKNKQLAESIKSKASAISSISQVTFVEQEDRYAAMCASDFGFLHNGQVTVEAAACQLPALIVNSMSNYSAYINYLYNGHVSPLNVSTGYHAYEQLLGSSTAIGEKIGDRMLSHFQNPKARFEYVKLYRQEIQKMLMLNGRNPEMSLNRTGLEAAAEDILKKISLRSQLKNDTKLNYFQRKQKLQLY